MEILNRNNYEAVYLDFLEGNLNEEDSVLLLDFLDENPDLKMEEDFVSLDLHSIELDSTYKQSLKQVLFDEDAVSILNVNSFLIAHTEGLLSANKELELKTFIALHPVFEHEQKLFNAAHLKANLEEVYSEKGSLKQARKIAMWPYFSAAAAACIILFLTFGNFNASKGTTLVANNSKKKNDSEKSIIKVENSSQVVEKKEDVKDVKDINNYNSEEKTTEEVITEAPQEIQIARIEKRNRIVLKTKRVKSFQTEDELLDLEMAYIQPLPEKNNTKVVPQYDYLGFNEMENPIVPITNKLSHLMKTDVDFRTTKPTKKHSGGIYIKIGKFVFSRQTS